VDFSLDFGQQCEHRHARRLHRLGQRGVFDQRPDLPERMVVMVVFVPVMMVGLRNGNRGADSGDAVRRALRHVEREVARQQRIEFAHDGFAVGPETDQRPEDHVPGGAAYAVETDEFHLGIRIL